MQLDQAFRTLNIIQDFLPPGVSNRPGTRLQPTDITIHNTDNTSPGANAAAHARYMKSQGARDRQVSWHFTVDDNTVFQSLPTNEVGWHAGPGNRVSIGIEICMHQGMNEAAAYDRAALLTAVMARQLSVAVPSGIVQHNKWTQKHCPRVLRDRQGGWAGFLEKVRNHYGALQNVYAAELVIEGLAAGDNCCEVMSTNLAGAAKSATKRATKRAAPKKRTTARRAKAKRRTVQSKSRTKTRARKRASGR